MREPEASLDPPRRDRRWPLEFGLVPLLALHIGLSLQLMGTNHQWRRLLSDDPVTSGRHALHLQQSLAATCGEPAAAGGGSFDPSCYAGYPRTSIFDAEARPTAFVQWLAGRRAGPAAYKVSLVGFVAVLPVAAWAAACLVNAGRGGRLVAAAPERRSRGLGRPAA